MVESIIVGTVTTVAKEVTVAVIDEIKKRAERKRTEKEEKAKTL